jgi:predicted RND superfamily exporter protein
VSRTYIEERFGGAMPLNVVVRGDADDFRTPEAIAGLVKVADAMAAESTLGWPVGLHSLVETLHGALAPDHPERVPSDRALLAQELLLYEMSGDERLEDVVSEDFSSARILARSEDALTDEVEATRDRVYAVARAAFPETMRVDVTSTMVLAQAVNRTLIGNMSMSFATAFLVIFITMFSMFRSWRLALLALAPNLAPLFCLVGFMAIVGIGLKVSTAFIFAIAFGIAVDDTIHFLARIKRERALGKTRDEAVEAAINGTGRAIVQTTLVLVIGFSILLASEFLATANFGLLTGVTLSAALVADLTLLPALLLTTRRW